MNRENLIGKHFGLLTVVSKTDELRNGKPVYECVCTCGRTVGKTRHDLNRGSKSCGKCVHSSVNETLPKHNTSKYLGVYRMKYRGQIRYCAQLVYNGKKHYGGIFTTPEAAYQRRLELEKETIPPELRKKHKK